MFKITISIEEAKKKESFLKNSEFFDHDYRICDCHICKQIQSEKSRYSRTKSNGFDSEEDYSE